MPDDPIRPEPAGPATTAAATASLLERVLPRERAFAVRLWDGTTLEPAGEVRADPPATIVLTNPDAVAEMFQLPIDVHLGEAFLRGDLEVEGDIEAAFEFLDHAEVRVSPMDWIRIAADAAKLGAGPSGPLEAIAARLRGDTHTPERDRQAITHHYDVSNDFYACFLGAEMVYSCAYWPPGVGTLDEAQRAKHDLICRKLRLRPGERFLDIGCGWGALAIHAAERCGARAVGVTLSEKQLDLARRRAREAGLDDRVSFELRDYRDLDGEYDKIASIGMAEHVGREQLPAYYRAAFERLAPRGAMLNHAIQRGPLRSDADERVVSGEFMRRYVFPDGEILPLWRSLEAAEGAGFEVRDVEDLREHYAETLRAWVGNLEARWDDAVAAAGEERARLWRLYMAGSAHRFSVGHLAIHQSLLAKPDARGRVGVPRTRDDLYA